MQEISLVGQGSGICCQPRCAGLCLPLFPPPRLLQCAPRGLFMVWDSEHLPLRRWMCLQAVANCRESIQLICSSIKPTPMQFLAKPRFLLVGKQASNMEGRCRGALLPCHRYYLLPLFGTQNVPLCYRCMKRTCAEGCLIESQAQRCLPPSLNPDVK